MYSKLLSVTYILYMILYHWYTIENILSRIFYSYPKKNIFRPTSRTKSIIIDYQNISWIFSMSFALFGSSCKMLIVISYWNWWRFSTGDTKNSWELELVRKYDQIMKSENKLFLKIETNLNFGTSRVEVNWNFILWLTNAWVRHELKGPNIKGSCLQKHFGDIGKFGYIGSPCYQKFYFFIVL